MSAMAAKQVRILEQMLRKECALYSDYILLLKKERSLLRKKDRETFEKVTGERGLLQEAMLAAQDRRLSLLRSLNLFNENQNQTPTLRSIVSDHCNEQDKKILLPLAEKLRALIIDARAESRHYSSIVGYTLSLLHSLRSIILSGRNTVVRSYGRTGTMQESFPAEKESSNVLKEA